MDEGARLRSQLPGEPEACLRVSQAGTGDLRRADHERAESRAVTITSQQAGQAIGFCGLSVAATRPRSGDRGIPTRSPRKFFPPVPDRAAPAAAAPSTGAPAGVGRDKSVR